MFCDLFGKGLHCESPEWQKYSHISDSSAASLPYNGGDRCWIQGAIDLEIKSTARQITINVVNSKLNAGLPTGRSNEASKIIQGLEKSIAGRARAGQVLMMHLDYVSRHRTKPKIIQGFDFNKSPSGAFVPHTT